MKMSAAMTMTMKSFPVAWVQDCYHVRNIFETTLRQWPRLRPTPRQSATPLTKWPRDLLQLSQSSSQLLSNNKAPSGSLKFAAISLKDYCNNSRLSCNKLPVHIRTISVLSLHLRLMPKHLAPLLDNSRQVLGLDGMSTTQGT